MGVINKFAATTLAYTAVRVPVCADQLFAPIIGLALLGVSPTAADTVYTHTDNVFVNYYPSTGNPFAGDSLTGSISANPARGTIESEPW